MKIVIALLILSFAIFFHELGHFIFAKLSKVKVNEFALGMGPKILSFKKGETEYTWRLFPIGGMCVMQGEDREDFSEGSFQKASVLKRILIVAAGLLFNFILAFVIAVIVTFSTGIDPASVAEINADSNAFKAGLQEGDLITSFEGKGVSNARELYMYLYMYGIPEDEINLKVLRDGQKISVNYAPDKTTRYMLGFSYSTEDGVIKITDFTEDSTLKAAGLNVGDVITSINGCDVSTTELFNSYISENPFDGSQLKIEYERHGLIYSVNAAPVETVSYGGGFSFNMAREDAGIGTKIAYSFGEIKYWINTTLRSLGSLFTGKFGIQDMSGPVGIVSAIGEVYDQAAADGIFEVIMSMLNMVILLSANLGVINLLPLPALDGGRLIFLIIEAVRRKPCNQKIEGMVHFVGIVALMALAVFIAFNDIIKLF